MACDLVVELNLCVCISSILAVTSCYGLYRSIFVFVCFLGDNWVIEFWLMREVGK